MNEEKESSKQFLNREFLEKKQEGYQKESVEEQQEHKDFFKKNLIEKKLGEELKKMEVEPEKLEKEIKKEKEQIKTLKKEGKLGRLLNIAQEKGAPLAVEIARSMNDPFILDALHDILVQKGFYEKFLK